MKLRTLIKQLEAVGNPDLDVYVFDRVMGVAKEPNIKFTSVNPDIVSIPSTAILFSERKSDASN